MSVKIGLIGLGDIIKSHIRAIREFAEIKISHVCDKDPQKLSHAMNALGCKGFTDYREMLGEDLDVVLVCLPHGLHCQVAVDGLRAGFHVMVEKPMAVSVAECNKMLATARDMDKHIIVTEVASFYPGVVRTGDKF